MAYIDPKNVTSPKSKVRAVEVVFDRGPVEDSWSVVRLMWDGAQRVGIRWNGDLKEGLGTPQARGNPTWFIVPEEIADPILQAAGELRSHSDAALAAGYSEMAADAEREAEAHEWIEGLVADAT